MNQRCPARLGTSSVSAVCPVSEEATDGLRRHRANYGKGAKRRLRLSRFGGRQADGCDALDRTAGKIHATEPSSTVCDWLGQHWYNGTSFKRRAIKHCRGLSRRSARQRLLIGASNHLECSSQKSAWAERPTGRSAVGVTAQLQSQGRRVRYELKPGTEQRDLPKRALGAPNMS